MPQKKEVMEFKIQLSYDGGKTWMDSRNRERTNDFKAWKKLCDFCREHNPKAKYRIVGRELMPWCEIKEEEVKYG